MNSVEDTWQQMIHGVCQGDEAACRRFWDQYGPLIEKVADRNLPSGLRRRVEPEDIVISACRTFFRRARGGEFQLPDAESLWRLLCAITLNKVRMQTRFHLREKRGLDREECIDARSQDRLEAAAIASPAVVVEFEDQLQQLVKGLGDEERQLVDLKLQEYTNQEVAEKLGCSERTVRRMLKTVQSRLQRMLGTEEREAGTTP